MKFTLLFGLLFLFTTSNAQLFVGDIALETQQQIDNFQSNCQCDSVQGNLYIAAVDLANLNGLSGLKYVSGNVTFSPNINLSLDLP